MPVGNGSTYCSECLAERRVSQKRDRDYKIEYEKRVESEDPRYRRFYRSNEWRLVSRHYANSVGYRCEECGAWGTDVHHVEPIQTAEGWERRFDETNLKMLCVRCHNKAHGRSFGSGRGGPYGRKAEEAARNAEGQSLEGGESPYERAGRGAKVSDFR